MMTTEANINHSAQKGFTLIELMVVLVILGILAAYIGPRMLGQTDKAMQVQAQVQIDSFSTALKTFKLYHKVYPTTEQGLSALITAPTGVKGLKDYPQHGYLDSETVPKDPWGNEYVYLCPGVHSDFDIYSYGADGVQGGEGNDKDITSWKTDE